MSSDILGTYDFANHYGINHKVDNKLAAQTIVHEIYHMRFTLCSSYGNFMQLSTRLRVIDSRFTYVNDFLLEHSLKMQEAVCTFSEVILLVASRSFPSANEYIYSLRDNNKQYYNYVRPLLPLLNFITENDVAVATTKIPAKEMLSIVSRLVSIAMDVDLTQINVDIFRSAKQLKAFSATEGVSEKFFPNKRFFSSIRALIDIFKTGADEEVIDKRIAELLASGPEYSKEQMELTVEKTNGICGLFMLTPPILK